MASENSINKFTVYLIKGKSFINKNKVSKVGTWSPSFEMQVSRASLDGSESWTVSLGFLQGRASTDLTCCKSGARLFLVFLIYYHAWL